MTRDEAIERTLATLEFFEACPQGPAADASGHRGFFYHFLDLAAGRRAHGCELSTMDTAILFAVIMIENFATEMIWRLIRSSPPVLRGLSRAGFSGGWLGR